MAFSRIRRHPILAAISILFALLIIFAVIIVIFAETIIKSIAQDKGGSVSEREFAIDEFDMKWGPRQVSVHATNVRLGNAEGYKEERMVDIQQIDFDLAYWKLLYGKIELGELKIVKPIIVLDKKDEDNANWKFPFMSEANTATEATIPDSRNEFPAIGKLILEGGKLTYRDQRKDMEVNLNLATATADGGEKNQQGFEISGDGTLQGQKFKLEANGGSLDMLQDSSKPFPLNLKLAMGATEVLVDGTFQDPVKMTGVDSTLKLKGNNLADLFYLTGIPLPPTPPYTLGGKLTKKEEVWAYNEFKGIVGGSDLSGDLSYDTGGDRGFFKADLFSKLLDAADLGGFIGLTPEKNATPEQKREAQKKKASPKLIPDVDLKTDRLKSIDMDVTLNAQKIEAPGIPFKGMKVRFDLNNGVLKLDPLDVKLADGTVDGVVEIDANKKVPPMKMALNLRRLSLKQFFKGSRFEETTNAFLGGKINLAGQGLSLADVLATSNGELAVIMSGGKISLLLVEASDIDIGQAFPLFLGKDRATELRCGVADFNVKDGILTSKAFVIDTADSLLHGDMAINMKNERIAAKLQANPKDASLFSAQTPIVVGGKLKDPSIGLDPVEGGARIGAAAILGTLLTPFAAIIPFIEIPDQKNANCRALIERAKN